MAKILLIEDLSDNANLARKILTNRGYEFFWASTAETGIQMALETPPDLILLDLGLPDMDGQTLAFLLREEPTLKHIPLVAMTAWPEDTALKIMDAYQLDGYIGKPISILPFLQKIEEILK